MINQNKNDLVVFNEVDLKEASEEKVRENEATLRELVNEIDLSNLSTIISFGSNAVDEISKLSDDVLRNTEMEKLSDTSEMLTSLGKIMDKFNPKELEPASKKGVFTRLFLNAKSQLDSILKKYNTMGEEVDKIYVELKKYENEIYEANNRLESLFNTNLVYYKSLTSYILAGEHGLEMISNYRDELKEKYEETADNSIKFEIQRVEQGKIALEQRIHDLRMAENVAMQSMPMLRTMQFANINLVRKINSAFIITLPVFKRSLAQAVMLKRQQIQMESLSALDERTNEMLVKNAHNTMEQTKLITELSSGSSIKMETLEETWKTIMNGVEETKRIQVDAENKRKEDMKRLEEIKKEFKAKALKQE